MFSHRGPIHATIRRRPHVTLPYEDVQMALQTGELDGVAWSGITEDYTVGWADVTKYYLTNPISGAWAGSYLCEFRFMGESPAGSPENTVSALQMDSSHYYRQHWYWWGEAQYRTKGGKLEADLHSPPRSGSSRGRCGTQILGRDRCQKEPQEVPRWSKYSRNTPRP